MVLLNELAKTSLSVIVSNVKDIMSAFIQKIDSAIPGNDKPYLKLYKWLILKDTEPAKRATYTKDGALVVYRGKHRVANKWYIVKFALSDKEQTMIGGECDGSTIVIELSKDRIRQYLLSYDSGQRFSAYVSIIDSIKSTLAHELTHAYQYKAGDYNDNEIWYDSDSMELLEDFSYLLYITMPIEVAAIVKESKMIYSSKLRRKGISFYRTVLAKYSIMFSKNEDWVPYILDGSVNLQQFIKKVCSPADKMALYYIFACVIPKYGLSHLLENDDEYQVQVIDHLKSVDMLAANCRGILELASMMADEQYKDKFLELAEEGRKEGWLNRIFYVNINNKPLIDRIIKAVQSR